MNDRNTEGLHDGFLDKLFDKYFRLMCFTAYERCRDRDLAEDIAAESFIKLIPKAELLKNFAIPTVIFSPDFSDPQVRQAMLTQGMNSVNNMFGTQQIAVKSVDFESESTVFTQDDLDNPAYASDTEIENDYPPMQEPDVIPEPEPEPEPDRSADFQCSRCGEVINERVYEYSINKFGEPLCIKCQRGGGRR